MKKVLFLVCIFASQILLVNAQDLIKVQGRVLDAKTNEPIAGASVFIENSVVGEFTKVAGQIQQSALGTVSDVDGKFTLSVPANIPYYTVMFIGYEKVRVKPVNDFKTVLLTSDEQLLNEVIVTGYTDIKKRNNTTAYDKVKVEEIRQIGVSGVDQLLEGQIAGVQLSNLNGGPNSAPKIRIRGTVSINGTQDPLWVLDGMPIEGTALPNSFDKDNLNSLQNLPIAGLNPDDIAEITVLKDAAATSIYGARAANGVIVITTKKGKSGPAKVQFSANSFVTQRPDYNKLNLMNASEKVDFELGLAGRTDLTYRTNKGAIARLFDETGELGAFQTSGLGGLSASTLSSIDALRLDQTNWGNELFRNALNQQYTASISGGSDKHNYYLSGGMFDEKATTKGVDMRRYSLTFNNEFKISDKFKGGVSLLGSTTNRNNFFQDVDGFTNPTNYARNVNPYLSVRNADGGFNYDQDIQGLANGTYIPFNIIEERENTSYSLANKALKAIGHLSYQIIPTLAIRTELGLQFDETGVEKYSAQNSYFTRKFREGSRRTSGGVTSYFIPEGGIIENQQNSAFQYNWKSFLEFNKTFNNLHEVTVLTGTELRRSNNNIITTKGFGFNDKTLTTQSVVFPTLSDANTSIYRQYQKSIGETAYASFYANAGYTYDRRYNVYGSIRYDGSNMFGVDPKYRFLPIWSISGAWNLTEEDFMQDQKIFNDIKIRASYGTQGNIDRNTYPFVVGTYQTGTILNGSETLISVLSAPNDKLRWEKTSSINTGFDVSAFNNRVHVTFDYYNRKSVDLIGASDLPVETGFDIVNRNWASVRNKGAELSISTRNITNRNFTWSTDFNIAQNKNKLLKVNTSTNAYTPDYKEGYPINSLFVLETAGLDADGLPQFVGEDGSIQSFEDFYQIYDMFEDVFPGFLAGTNLEQDTYRAKFKYKGSLDPQFIGGITNRFRYKSFDFAVSALFNINQLMRKAPAYNPALVDRGFNYSKDILSAGEGNNPAIGTNDSFSTNRWMAYAWLMDMDPINSYRYLDVFTKKMTYMRINSIRLGYSFPQETLKKLKMSNLRVNVEGRNLFVLSNGYKGYFDPETYGNNYAQPISKSFAIGLSASF